MSSISSSPDIEIILVESDDIPEDEEHARTGKEFSGDDERQWWEQNKVQAEGSCPSQPSIAANSLQEIVDIVHWAKTGAKRNKGCTKSFMEKRFDEMERGLEAKMRKLEQAQLEICVLKQIKVALQAENKTLKMELAKDRNENAELTGKLIVLQDFFHAMQVTHFSDSNPNDQSYQNNQQSSFIGQVKMETESEDQYEEMSVPEVLHQYVPIQDEFNVGEAKVSALSSETKDQLVGHSGTSQQAVVSNAENVNHEEPEWKENLSTLQAPAAAQLSSTALFNSQKNRGSRNRGETDQHGIDHSKEQQGAYCLCGFKSTNTSALNSHIVYFTCEKKFKCSICQKLFVGSNYLKGHMKRSHKVIYTKTNGCRDCGNTFASLRHLRQHKNKDCPIKMPNATCTRFKKTKPTASIKYRRSVRMKRKHLKGEVNSVVSLLQGNCIDCGFCREQKNNSKCRQIKNNVAVANLDESYSSTTMSSRIVTRKSTSTSGSIC